MIRNHAMSDFEHDALKDILDQDPNDLKPEHVSAIKARRHMLTEDELMRYDFLKEGKKSASKE